MRKIYTPGDDVLKDTRQNAQEEDSEDDRLMAQVRESSLAGADTGAARHRAERSRDRRRRQESGRGQQRDDQARLTEARLQQHDQHEPHVEHQPSLRSLLSASDAGSRDVQAEILRSIYEEGVLEGVDLDNLTPAQEEELTDRIAAAYRRRQQQQQPQPQNQTRDRSRIREHRPRSSRSPQIQPAAVSSQPRQQAQSDSETAQQQSRARPPISRPHLFEQGLQEPARTGRRSASSTSQRTNRSAARNEDSSPANRSATDLSLQPASDNTQRSRHSRLSGSGRSITDPDRESMREQVQRMRAESNQERPASSRTVQSARDTAGQSAPDPAHDDTPSPRSIPVSSSTTAQQAVRPAVSMAAFAPELVASMGFSHTAPSISCDRCGRHEIQYGLHYNCSRCSDGNFNICLRCYRTEQGCNYWFGFGFRANDRWYRNAPPEGWPQGQEMPHVLIPRRYTKGAQPNRNNSQPVIRLQEGAFCESCFTFADDCYWYCTDYCLEGAWGFCDNCVKQGRHCTHALLLTSHVSYLQQPHYDPTKSTLVDLPHLAQGSYATLPPTTHCDICHRPIPPNSTRFHCYQCSSGDYDMCKECYRGLVTQGKISQANGPDGWRRCLQGHRMAIVGYQDRLEGGHLRRTISEMVGGWDFKDDEATRAGQAPSSGRLPPAGGQGMRCLSLYSYFPAEGVTDELAFPKNAELREVKDVQNDDWYLGVYAGAVNLIPRNHVRML